MVYYTQHYVIDWDKVKSVEDIKVILKAMRITFEPDFGRLAEVGDFVRLEEKPPIGKMLL